MPNPLRRELDPEELISCPYNDSHRIRRKRIQFHLTKCRLAHPDARKEDCPYNACHRINEQEIQYHIENCPDRDVIIEYITKHSETDTVEEQIPMPDIPPSDENWDNECSPTYDPKLNVANQPILHKIIGGTKSERKQCRLNERRKFQSLQETGSLDISFKQRTNTVPMDQPLRKAKTIPAAMGANPRRFEALNKSITSDKFDMSIVASELLNESSSSSSLASSLSALTAGTRVSENKLGNSKDSDDDFTMFVAKGRGRKMRM